MSTPGGEAAQTYIGSELELFAQARRWKAYVRDRLAPHIRGDVLEVGAGIGSFTQTLAPLSPLSWCCLEPDPALVAEIEKRRESGLIPPTLRILNGVLASLPDEEKFDTLIYLDVLEHIEDDSAEMRRAAARLRPGGKLIVLVPAFQSVYSAFDAAIGHYRRYTRKTLQAVKPPSLLRGPSFYMDAPGLMLSLGNRLLLRSDHPRAAQIEIWDRFIVPLARILDPLVARGFGRSVVAIWQAPMGQKPG
jgi:SAM-dependent methyltransferase